MKKSWIIILLAFLFAVACTTTTTQTTEPATQTTEAATPPVVEPVDLTGALFLDPGAPIEDRVEDLLARMTLEEKIGQMTQANRGSIRVVSDITTYALGSILSGGGDVPRSNTPLGWVDMYDSYQTAALATRLHIPMIYGIDAVHGHNNVYGATIFPHNIGMGATRNPALVEQAAHITAIEMAATGMDWNFAPCLAVAQDERWGRTYESYSEDPALVSLLGAAAIRGFQGADLLAADSIVATAKHYLADGGTLLGDDRGNAVVSEAELRRLHLAPYVAAIEAGAQTVMVSYSSWNGLKMHGNRYLVTDVLRGELGFDGFVVSDWAAQRELPGTALEQVAATINAGIDMVMVPDRYAEFIGFLLQNVASGAVSMERIDQAVRNILTVKFRIGLFERPMADRSMLDLVGSQAHRDVARQAVRESVVLLKNDRDVLPIDPSTPRRILVAGVRADNLGAQCGGWTITWQGQAGNTLTRGTTILAAIRAAVGPDVVIDYTLDGSGGEEADLIIAVVGENPYAEMEGDRPAGPTLSPADIAVINNAASIGVPVVTVLISGRPMLVTAQINQSDAFLAAWLPGTEGAGVVDVIFGAYAPTGRLPMTWPRSADQLPINIGDGQEGLFDYGFGLTY